MEQKIKSLLISTSRPGINSLIKAVVSDNYFTCPASTRYHKSFEGGLALHSYNVLGLMTIHLESLKPKITIPKDSVIICSLLHDLCKLGRYRKTKDKYVYVPGAPSGHALLSLEYIQRYISLDKLEYDIIKYHMGYYGTTELSSSGEYSLSQLAQANQNPLIKLFHWCDDMDAQFG